MLPVRGWGPLAGLLMASGWGVPTLGRPLTFLPCVGLVLVLVVACSLSCRASLLPAHMASLPCPFFPLVFRVHLWELSLSSRSLLAVATLAACLHLHAALRLCLFLFLVLCLSSTLSFLIRPLKWLFCGPPPMGVPVSLSYPALYGCDLASGPTRGLCSCSSTCVCLPGFS